MSTVPPPVVPSPEGSPGEAPGILPESTRPDVDDLVIERKRPWTKGRIATHIFLAIMALLWLFPLLYATLASLRSYQYTAQHGYLSFGGFTLQNYTKAWEVGQFGEKFVNSAIITIPAVILTLFLASMVAFVIARFSWTFNIVMLALLLAGNLLPPQALLIPVFKLFQNIEVPFWL